MSLRKSFSELSAPSPALRFQTLAAQRSNSTSCVTPRSSVIASNSVRPGDLRLLFGSPPCRCRTTSVVRFRAVILLTPATNRPSHLMRNLKFLYGSKRCVFTANSGIGASSGLDLAGHLLDPDDDELGRFERREPDEDVHDPAVDVALGRRLRVTLDEVGFAGRDPLEGALP